MTKVLIVDDSSFQRKCIKKLLTELSYDVIESENGEEALKLLEQESPELIIVDLLMPIMGGLELLEKLNSSHPDLKAMVITSDIQKTVQEKCRELGVYSFINKPILKDQFNEEIRNIFTSDKKTA